MYTLTLEIKGLPKSTNQLLGSSWGKKKDNAVLWKKIVKDYVRGKEPPEPLTRVKLSLVRCNYRTLDYDGCVASMKPVVDGLVEAGVLQNDTWKITGKWDVDQEFRPKELGGMIRIRVEEV